MEFATVGESVMHLFGICVKLSLTLVTAALLTRLLVWALDMERDVDRDEKEIHERIDKVEALMASLAVELRGLKHDVNKKNRSGEQEGK